MGTIDVIIIGAGPAGLFCAIRCAAAGLRPLVLEKNAAAGKKLLISGSGRCNITHAGAMDDFLAHYGDRGRFVKPALFNFTNNALTEFFGERGLPMAVTESGKIFPAAGDARDVLRVLLDECALHGAAVRPGGTVGEVTRTPSGFEARAGGSRYSAASLVIATGGKSYPATGSTGDGYAFARSLGHSVEPPAPGLAPALIRDYRFSGCAGISLDDAAISLSRDGKKLRETRGDVLFTHRGLSGPGVLDFSRYIGPGDILCVSLTRSSPEELESAFSGGDSARGAKSLKKVIAELGVPARLTAAVLASSGIAPDLKLSHLDRNTRRLVVALLTALPLEVGRLGGWNEAMVTRGGVPVKEIRRESMESRLVPRLFFAGEVIDVDGDTGGYNLQFAFSSAALAAKEIVEAITRRSISHARCR